MDKRDAAPNRQTLLDKTAVDAMKRITFRQTRDRTYHPVTRPERLTLYRKPLRITA